MQFSAALFQPLSIRRQKSVYALHPPRTKPPPRLLLCLLRITWPLLHSPQSTTRSVSRAVQGDGRGTEGGYVMTRSNPWKDTCSFILYRCPGPPLPRIPEPLDPGVNFFVLALEHLGAKTLFSCDGHGRLKQFYVMFKAPYKLACAVARVGYFEVELSKRPGVFSLRCRMDPLRCISKKNTPRTKETRQKEWATLLTYAAHAWEEAFGFHITV